MAYKLTRKTALGIKLETTQNTAVVPSTSTDYILVKDANIKVNTEKLERDYKRTNLDPLPHQIGKRSAEITFATELKWSGNSGSLYAPLDAALKSCGFAQTTTAFTCSYVPISDAPSNMYGPATSSTIELYKDGKKHVMTGAVGTFKINLENGKYGEIEFTFKGDYAAPTDASNPTPTFNTLLPPVVQALGLVVSGSTPEPVYKFDFDMGNEINPIDDVNAADATLGFAITSRKPVGSFDPLVGTSFDAFANLTNATEMSASFTLGSTDGNKVKIQFDSVQLSDVSYADSNGFLKYELPLKINGTGNNSVVFKFM